MEKQPQVIITRKIPKQVEEYIAEHCEYEMWQDQGEMPREILFDRLYNKAGILVQRTVIDEELLIQAPHLKVVSNVSVGYNNFDLAAMKSRGVIGTHTPGVLDHTVADLIMGLMLSTARRIPELDQYVKAGKWQPTDNENLYGLDVHHATLGIIGMGRIGEMVAKRAALGFDMKVLYYNRKPKPGLEAQLGVRYSDLDSLLQTSDFVLVMTPLTKETYHLIDARALGLMKKSAILINASRGQTVDEAALIEALENNQIYGAGLDVYETEPIEGSNPLLKMKNVVTVPHIGSATEKTRLDMTMLAAKNLVAALKNHIPPNIVPELKG